MEFSEVILQTWHPRHREQVTWLLLGDQKAEFW
jgi:hypothetical protein